MRSRKVGVMIARGDLAVEVGFERLAEVQEEILWACEAAHVPVVWATQVLDTLARTGQPSRAEVTDAAMSERAECVMLNKGPHIIEAIEALDSILDPHAAPSAQEAQPAPPAPRLGRQQSDLMMRTCVVSAVGRGTITRLWPTRRLREAIDRFDSGGESVEVCGRSTNRPTASLGT